MDVQYTHWPSLSGPLSECGVVRTYRKRAEFHFGSRRRVISFSCRLRPRSANSSCKLFFPICSGPLLEKTRLHVAAARLGLIHPAFRDAANMSTRLCAEGPQRGRSAASDFHVYGEKVPAEVESLDGRHHAGFCRMFRFHHLLTTANPAQKRSMTVASGLLSSSSDGFG